MTEHTLPPVQPTKYDNLFKEVITAGWAVKSDGHVEAPQGYFAVVEIPENLHELKEMQDAVEEGKTPWTEWPDSGWYFTVENSDGLIFVYLVTQHDANLFFGEYQDAFIKWDGE